jgi:ribosome-binding factor A
MTKRFDHSKGPSQRMLRAGENIRHVLVEVLARGDIRDPAITGVSVTVGEVRMSPDLKHANVFVSALGQDDGRDLAAALTRASRYIRGEVGRMTASKFTPELHFIADGSYAEAMRMSLMFNDPKVARDLRPETGEDKP